MAELPIAVRDALEHLLELLDGALPGFVQALYVHGSLALGAWTAGLSDVDFVAVAQRPATAADLAHLRAAHEQVARAHPAVDLSGSYLQAADLGRPAGAVQPHPHFHDGILYPAGLHDINDVTWWLLKQHGLTVRGPAAQQLPYAVDWNALLDAMHANMNTYWGSFTRQPGRIAWLLSDYGVQWTVLGVLRQWYTFREHAITSKVGAGEYALDHLPKRWHALVREAIAIRAGFKQPRLRLRLMRAIETHALLCALIAACDTHPSKPPG